MRIVVVGATGNVGTSVLEALGADGRVDEIVAIARRTPPRLDAQVTFVAADVTRDELGPAFAGADCVIHLAWLIQPGRNESITRAVNVDGSRRVFAAAAAAGVGSLVYASSVGAYSAGPKDRMVDETWPTGGTPTSFYSRHKVEVERLLDRFEREQPQVRVVRLRPGLIFKREAATEIRRLFVGPLLPSALIRSRLIPVVPDHPRLCFQAVHSRDVGRAYGLAALSDVRGAFNIAAGPPLGSEALAQVLEARRVRVPAALLRSGAAAAYSLRLTPTEPGWLDMGLSVPLMDCTRAQRELGWSPRHSSVEAVTELLDGLGSSEDHDTPPLARQTTGPARVRELLTGIGARP